MEKLMQLVSKLISGIGQFFYDLYEDGVKGLWRHIENNIGYYGDTFDRDFEAEIDKWAKTNNVNAEIVEEAKDIIEFPVIIRWAMFFVFRIQFGLSRVWSYVGAMKNIDDQVANEDVRPNLIDQGTAMRAAVLDPTKFNEAKDLLGKWGIPDSQQALMWSAIEQLPSLTELIPLLNRGIITSDDFIKVMTQHGFKEETAQQLMQLRWFYPSPSDIISLIGREAFEPEAIAKFDLLRDFTDIDPKHYEKAGITEEVAKMYWVAHWQNPSLNQVFSMIHRKVVKEDGERFSLDDLSTYYKLADVNPFFGDLLRQIAFAPLGRVDTRRMFRMGVLSREQVFESYEAQGYSPDNAELLTQFTEAEKEQSDRDLSRSQIEKLYKLGQVNEEELRGMLEGLGYSQEEAFSIQYLLQGDIEEDRLKSFIARAEVEYKRSMIDAVKVRSFLATEGIGSGRVKDLIEKWDNELVKDRTRPTKDDWLSWLGSEIVSETEFINGMLEREYSMENILRYLEAN